MVTDKTNNPGGFGYDEAVKVVMRMFMSLVGRKGLPSWFTGAVTVGGFKRPDNRWVIRYTVLPRTPLPAGMFWEDFDGEPIVRRIDAKTGKKHAVISYPGAEPVILFEAVVADDENCEVTVSVDLSTFGSDYFERFSKPEQT